MDPRAADPDPDAEAEPYTPEPGFEKLPRQYAKDKFVKGLFHALHHLNQSIPGGVKAAVALHQEITKLGGVEAIREIETERNEWRETDQGLAEGNPAVLDKIAQESPAGFVKLMGPALDKLQQVDPEAYNHSLSKIFWNTLQQMGAVNDLANLEDALLRGDLDGAKAQIQKVGKFLSTINGFASKVPEKKVDPEREKFLKEKKDFESTKEKDFRDSVLSETRNHAVSRIEGQLAKEFTSRGMDLAKLKSGDDFSYKLLMRNCFDNLNQALAKDPATSRFQAALKSGKRDDALSVARNRIDGLYSEVVAKTVKAFYSVAGTKAANTIPAPQVANGNSQIKATPGVMKLTKPPRPEDFDYPRMLKEFGNDKMRTMIYNSRGYVKGKQALYDWN